MPLTDTQIRNAKPRNKAYKLSDFGGLFLLLNTGGSKLWRFKYRMHGKEKLLSIGEYPDVGLLDARRIKDEARSALAEGRDQVPKNRKESGSKGRGFLPPLLLRPRLL